MLRPPPTLSQGGLQPQWWALQDNSNDSFVWYQDLSEYVGLQNIECEFCGETALKEGYKT